MSFVKGLSGFISGAGAGVIAVAAVSLYVPQFQGSETPTEEAASDVVQPTLESAEQNTAEVTEESEPATTDIEAPKQEVAIVEDAPKIEGDAVDVTKDETASSEDADEDKSKQEEAVESLKQEVAQVETNLPESDANIEEPMSKAEGDTDTPNEVTVEAPKSETPKLVLNSELPKAEEKPKKFKLPTIEAEKPADEVLEVVETPKTENEITVGKKPSSKLPKITAAAPETEAEQDDVKFASRALELYATKFEGTDKPLMGVILRDIGDKGLAVDKLKK